MSHRRDRHRHDLYAGYFPGVDCKCGAYGECECGCCADWTPKVEKLVKAWRDMPASEMRLRCGEMTAQEIRTVRAVLNQIMPSNDLGIAAGAAVLPPKSD